MTKTAQESATKKQGRKETRSSSDDLEIVHNQNIANENAINALQYNLPDNLESQIRSHRHLESAENVTKNYQDEVKLSYHYAKYHTKSMNVLWKFEFMWGGNLEHKSRNTSTRSNYCLKIRAQSLLLHLEPNPKHASSKRMESPRCSC